MHVTEKYQFSKIQFLINVCASLALRDIAKLTSQQSTTLASSGCVEYTMTSLVTLIVSSITTALHRS